MKTLHCLGCLVIVAVAASAADPALDVARWIATEARERLLVLAPTGTVIEGGSDVRFLPGTSDQDLAAILGDIRERLPKALCCVSLSVSTRG